MPALQWKASQGPRVTARQPEAAQLTSKAGPTVHTKKEQSRITDSNQLAQRLPEGKGCRGTRQ